MGFLDDYLGLRSSFNQAIGSQLLGGYNVIGQQYQYMAQRGLYQMEGLQQGYQRCEPPKPGLILPRTLRCRLIRAAYRFERWAGR